MEEPRRFNLWGKETTDELRTEIERERAAEKVRKEREERMERRRREREKKMLQITKDIDTLLYDKDLFGEAPTDEEREKARRRLSDYLERSRNRKRKNT